MFKKSYKKVGNNIVRTLSSDDIEEPVKKSFEVVSLQNQISRIDLSIVDLQQQKSDLEAALRQLQGIKE